MNRFKRVYRLYKEFQVGPIWVWAESFWQHAGDVDFSIPAAVAERLERWSAWFNSTYERDDPRDMGFMPPEERMKFDREGLQIWRALREHVSNDCRLVYLTKLDLNGEYGLERSYI